MPERVWERLASAGPSYAASLAEQLSARDASVTNALRVLVRRGRAVVEGRDGHRVIYRALGAAAEPEPEQEQVDAALRSALDVDVILSRAAAPTCELEALMFGNRGLRGWS